VYLIAEAVAAKLGVAWDRDALVRMKAIPALKNVFHFQARIDLLDGAHAVRAERVRGRRVLLFDDLYRSGATLSAAARALRDEGQVAEVRVLAVTRTRSRR
jgi:predicted amidophosphoribosyltransferase